MRMNDPITPKHRRVGLIDELRGFAILLMVAYHAGYDLIFLFGVDIPFYGFITEYLQPVVAGLFIVMSGIACRYSRNNAKRGLKALLLGMVLTAVTMIAMPTQSIYFGILHFMGTAMLLFALLKSALDWLPPGWGMLFSAAAFLFTYHLPQGWVGFWSLLRIPLPSGLYENRYLLPFGFAGAGTDYFPLLPWIFLYFFGCYLGMLFIRGLVPNWMYRSHSRFLSSVGKHTIMIYLLHQPVVYGLFLAVFWCLGKLQVL